MVLLAILTLINNCHLTHSRGGDSALHMAALHDKSECMKLLLRSGADPVLHNAQDKTPLDIAQERGHSACEELVKTSIFFKSLYTLLFSLFVKLNLFLTESFF